METNEINLEITTQPIDASVIESQDRALIDKQIATAKQYPRNIVRVKQNIVGLVAMDIETARSCGYALPRDGKTIYGASVHLARIVAQQYGNIRIDARISDIGRTHVTGQATCIDLENNVGIRVEVKRRITGKNGNRFSDDMITVTGNAAASIALRNAVFAVVPKPLIDAGYNAARGVLVGDVSDDAKLLAKREKTIVEFIDRFGVTENDILKLLGLREKTQIKADQILTLVGVWQAINDGDTTVDEIFARENPADSVAATKSDAAVAAVTEILRTREQKRAAMKPNEAANQTEPTTTASVKSNANASPGEIRFDDEPTNQ